MARKLPYAGDCAASFILHPFQIIWRGRENEEFIAEGKHGYLIKKKMKYFLILGVWLISQKDAANHWKKKDNEGL